MAEAAEQPVPMPDESKQEAAAPEPTAQAPVPNKTAEGASPSAPAAKADKPEKQAKAVPTDLKSLTVRQYLEATVVAVLLKGLQEVVKQRPEDPLDFLAQFLIKHNPKKPAGEAGGSGK